MLAILLNDLYKYISVVVDGSFHVDENFNVNHVVTKRKTSTTVYISIGVLGIYIYIYCGLHIQKEMEKNF